MQSKEAIVVLTGGFSLDKDGKLISSDFEKGERGPPGSIIRMLAALYLYQENPDRLIIVSGGRGEWDDLLPKEETLSGVLKQELIENGVPEENIIEENKGNNTYRQLRALLPIIEKYKLSSILVTSHSHHLPRIEATLKYLPELSEVMKIAKTVSADDIVIKKDPSWKKIIKEAYQREPTLTIIAKEKIGTEQIKNGTYKLNKKTASEDAV